jgi:hypothetical protein
MNDKDMDMWMKRFNNEFHKEMNLRMKVFTGNEDEGIRFLNTLEHRHILNPAKARNLRDIVRGKVMTPKSHKLPPIYHKMLEWDEKHDKMMKRKRECEEGIKKVDAFLEQYANVKKARDEFHRVVGSLDTQ